MKAIVIIFLCFTSVFGTENSYRGYKTYEVVAKTKNQAEFLHGLSENGAFDFWVEPKLLDLPSVVMVSPEYQLYFENQLNNFTSSGLNWRVLVENVEESIQQENQANVAVTPLALGDVSFSRFMTFQEIEAYLFRLERDFPSIVTLELLGETFEDHRLHAVRISSGPGCKPVILVDAGIHAREWIAPPTALYLIHQLVENLQNQNMIADVDWLIIPVLNPDGYDYTFTHNRLWRANRSPTPNSACRGTDLNRNFGYHWMTGGASAIPCAETFAGPAAFSELESQHLRDLVLRLKDYIKLYVSFHSYGNMILHPWGYTSDLPEDNEELGNLGHEVSAAIVQVGGEAYRVGSSTNVLYVASGGSDDWVKGVGGVELSYCIELPAGGSIGFNPPANRIHQIVSETFEGFKVFHDYIRTNKTSEVPCP